MTVYDCIYFKKIAEIFSTALSAQSAQRNTRFILVFIVLGIQPFANTCSAAKASERFHTVGHVLYFSDSCLTYLLVKKKIVQMQYEIVQFSEFLLTHKTIEIKKQCQQEKWFILLSILSKILKKGKTLKSQRKKNFDFFSCICAFM